MVEAQSLMIPSLARKPSHHPKTNQSWNHRNIPVREDPLDISIDSLILNKMLLNRRVSTWYRDEVCFDTHDITSPVSIIVILAENLIIPQPVVFFKKIFQKVNPKLTRLFWTFLVPSRITLKVTPVTNSLPSFKYHQLWGLRGYIDFDNGCWRRSKLMTVLRCWWSILYSERVINKMILSPTF